MNTIIIKCLALSLLPIGIDAAISWKDLTEMRKNTNRYIQKQEKKEAKRELKLSKEDKEIINEFVKASFYNTQYSNTYIRD